MKRREFIALVGGAAVVYPIVALAQPAAQSDALNTYNKAVSDFRSILGQRRAQISSKQPLPNLPGQDLYLARNKMMGAYKDLTDAVPAKIGRRKNFDVPPPSFDPNNGPLLDEYSSRIGLLEAPP